MSQFMSEFMRKMLGGEKPNSNNDCQAKELRFGVSHSARITGPSLHSLTPSLRCFAVEVFDVKSLSRPKDANQPDTIYSV
jgi:hypothetical protein